MKIKLSKTLRAKVSKMQSTVKEPREFERRRKVLFGWTVFLSLIWLPLEFLIGMGMDLRFTCFLCGFIMMGILLLTSMIQPGTRTFWLLFVNFFIGLPLVTIFFPFGYLLRFSDLFSALLGLFPLWIPIVYLIFFTWKNIQLKKKHREQYVEKVQSMKVLKLKQI
ncbi:MAG: hypothetical protein NE327_14295 [Lentisphaeraceae bacterium]|nr:hypothetical protein [Lentisphaeraceae bacterium]